MKEELEVYFQHFITAMELNDGGDEISRARVQLRRDLLPFLSEEPFVLEGFLGKIEARFREYDRVSKEVRTRLVEAGQYEMFMGVAIVDDPQYTIAKHLKGDCADVTVFCWKMFPRLMEEIEKQRVQRKTGYTSE